jgi:hypothetical protein
LFEPLKNISALLNGDSAVFQGNSHERGLGSTFEDFVEKWARLEKKSQDNVIEIEQWGR